MSDAEEPEYGHGAREKSVHWSIKLMLVLLMLYAFSFGPLLFLCVKVFSLSRSPIGEQAMLTYGMPHFYVAHQSKGYFEYLSWFVQRATGSGLAPSHEIFRKAFEGTVWPEEFR